MNPIIDITGQKFGRLTAIAPAGKRGASRSMRWHCRCDCGRETTTLGVYLRNGRTKSCGCTRGPQGPTGSRKKRPAWATVTNLKREILGPSLRYMSVTQAFYRGRQTLPEISRETGIKPDQLAIMLMRIRRAMNVKPEPKTEVVGALPTWRRGEEWMEGRVMQKDQRGLRKTSSIPAMFSDEKLRACIMTIALRNYEIAERFWIRNQTIEEIAHDMGLSKSLVGLQTFYIRHRIEGDNSARKRRFPVYLTRLSW